MRYQMSYGTMRSAQTGFFTQTAILRDFANGGFLVVKLLPQPENQFLLQLQFETLAFFATIDEANKKFLEVMEEKFKKYLTIIENSPVKDFNDLSMYRNLTGEIEHTKNCIASAKQKEGSGEENI